MAELLGEVDDGDRNLEEILFDQALGIGENVRNNENMEDQPVASGPSNSRVGNSLYVGGTAVGHISYLLHWDPPSYSARCKLHSGEAGGCYCTADINKVDECELEAWLTNGPKYLTAREHVAAKPAGTYNRRCDR